MHKSLNFLIEEYCEALARTRRMKDKASKRGEEGKNDVSQLTSMENSLSWAIEYMVTGYMPQYSEGPYKRQVPTDPQLLMTRFSSNSTKKKWNSEKSEAVQKILDKLSVKEKECIMLVWGEGFSYDEAGRIMKLPKTTVWDCCKRAIEKLRKIDVDQYRVKGSDS